MVRSTQLDSHLKSKPFSQTATIAIERAGIAALEGLENRRLMSITAIAETDPVNAKGDAADDVAIWVNPVDATRSAIIGTNKAGGIAVYDLSGKQLSYRADGKLNSVDVRSNFRLSGTSVSLVAASNRSDDTIALYTIDPETRELKNVAARSIATGVGAVYGLTMYQNPTTGQTFAFIGDTNEGAVEQWELFDAGNGKVDARLVRSFDIGGKAEGMVADDTFGHFYIAEEDGAIWKYSADPTAGQGRVQIDAVGSGRLKGDLEGLALYTGADGKGYLMVSDQGNNAYVVYERQGTNRYVTTFKIAAGVVDAVTGSDGIDVTGSNLGGAFAGGLFVAQDDSNDNGNQNFKLVSWADIASDAGLTFLSTTPTTPTPTPAPAPTPAPTPTPAPQRPGNSTTVPPVEAIVDNRQASYTGTWRTSKDARNYYGINYAHDVNARKGTKSVEFETALPAGTYTVYARWVDGRSNASNAPYTIYHANGQTTVKVDQRRNGGQWVALGTYSFLDGDGSVVLSNLGTNGAVIADAIRFVSSTLQQPAPRPTAPTAPSNLAVTGISTKAIALKWDDNSSDEVGFRIQRSTDGVNWTQIAVVGANVTQYEAGALAAGTQYQFRVRASNDAGHSSFTNVVTATTKAATTNPTPAPTPTPTPTPAPTPTPTPSNPPTTNPGTQPTAKPDASNTGLTNAGILVKSGSITVTKDGTVLENLDVTGSINVLAKNVIIRNVRVTATGGYCINVEEDVNASATILNSELDGNGLTNACLNGGGFTARYLNIHNSAKDGINPKGNVTVEYSWVHDLGRDPSAHADAVQFFGYSNYVFRYNNFDIPKNVPGTKSNACFMIQTSSGPISNILIEGNWLNGGNYTIYMPAGENIKIINNRFGDDYKYGIFTQEGSTPVQMTWSGNVSDRTGATVLP